MTVLIGYAVGTGLGIVLGLVVVALTVGSFAGPIALLVLSTAGSVIGVLIALQKSRGMREPLKMRDTHWQSTRRDVRASENWGLIDYWEMLYRIIDPRLIPRSIERMRPDWVRVTATYDGIPVVLTHSAARGEGEFVVSTRWDGLDMHPALRAALSKAWWRAGVWG